MLCWPIIIFMILLYVFVFFFQAEDGIRDCLLSRGLGDVYKRQKQYYMGYKDFGYTYIKIGGISARKFRYGNSGSFECVLAAQGCHDSDDCHGPVSYTHLTLPTILRV